MPMVNGKPVRARYTSLKLNELSSVDRPAQVGATAAILKRADPAIKPTTKHTPLMAIAVAKYICEDDGAHTFQQVLQANAFDEQIWPMTSALSQAIRSIMGDTTLAVADKEAKVTQSVAEFLSSVRAISPSIADDAEKKLAQLTTKRNPNMPTIEELTAKVAELTGQLASANALATSEKARAEKAEGELTAEKAAHVETKKALTTATDEVVKVGETEVRKSIVGDAQFAVTKALIDDRDTAKIEKRASEEFGHVVGTPAEKALVLKAANRFDEPTRKAFDAIMASAEKMAGLSFQTFGKGGDLADPNSDVAKALQTWTAKVAEIAKRDNIAEFEAMSKARHEFPEEFQTYQDSLN